ncbi:MAG: hypothetical protein H7259_03025 [Cytophagales bacterium]|nr:hypothetical protein [Cytophaga sp.]
MPEFLPTGLFEPSDRIYSFVINGTDEVLAFEGESVRITYTVGYGYLGMAFLNKDNSWNRKVYINRNVTKMTCKVRSTYNYNFTLLPFGKDKFGKKELYQQSNRVLENPVYETAVINLSGYPEDGFVMPLSIGFDFGGGPFSPLAKPATGTKVIID